MRVFFNLTFDSFASCIVLVHFIAVNQYSFIAMQMKGLELSFKKNCQLKSYPSLLWNIWKIMKN